ncbi:MAG: hypothetical protein P4M11_11275 [Candidatus Pacebacteria bacterium]|nr:hypothetical protein [Candidatus Paceibacterota bacterium]
MQGGLYLLGFESHDIVLALQNYLPVALPRSTAAATYTGAIGWELMKKSNTRDAISTLGISWANHVSSHGSAKVGI